MARDELVHVCNEGLRVTRFVRPARQHGKSHRTNMLLCATAAANGGVPERGIIMQVRGMYVIWEPTGEVRTVEQRHL